MISKDFSQWKYARNYQLFHNKCYRCKTELTNCIQTVKIGNKIIKNAQVLTCPNCSEIKKED
jgi:DNA-directed RNA polymerase subunit RPC12/RpoP